MSRQVMTAIGCLALFACSSPTTNHYVIASTGTVIGVEVAQNPANQTPEAKLGYNRAELALVPTSRPPCAIPNDNSTVNCGEIKGPVKDVPDVLMELRYGGIFDLGASSGIYQRLAVGETAVSQPGAAFLFAKDTNGTIEPATAKRVAGAFSAAEGRTEELRGRVDTIVAGIVSQSDPSRIDPGKRDALIARADLDPTSPFVRSLQAAQTVDDFKSLLEIPGNEEAVAALLAASS